MKSIAVIAATLVLVGCRGSSHHHGDLAIMPPDSGEKLWFFNETGDEIGRGGELEIFVDPEIHPHAGASFAKYTKGIGAALPVHRHARTEEFACIISGEGVAVSINEGGEESEIPIAVGYVWYNPPGVWHAVRNKGETQLSMIFATVPNDKKGLLSFFRRIGVAPGKTDVPITPEELERIAAEHDMILMGAEEE